MNDFQPTSPVFQGMQGPPLGFDPAGIGPNSPAILPQASPVGPSVLGQFQQQQQFLNTSSITSGAYQHESVPVEANTMQFYTNNPMQQQQQFPDNGQVSMNGGHVGGMTQGSSNTIDQPYCSPLAQMMNQVGAMGNPISTQPPSAGGCLMPPYSYVGQPQQQPQQQNQFIQQQLIPSFPPMEMQPVQQQQSQLNSASDFPDLDALFNDRDFKPDSKAGELAQIDLDQVRNRNNFENFETTYYSRRLYVYNAYYNIQGHCISKNISLPSLC